MNRPRLSRLARYWHLALVLALVILALPCLPVIAQDETEPTPWDVILVMDQSGSMFQSSDPCEFEPDSADVARPVGLPLRQWGAIKFIDYLGVDPVGKDRIGIIYFGSETGATRGENRYDLFLAADLDESEAAKRFLKKDDCPPEMGWTNINSALNAARDELTSQNGDRQQVIVLLTDGKPELTREWGVEDKDGVPGKRSYYTEHFEIIEQLKEDEIKLFVIALGESAQTEDPDLDSLGIPKKFRDLWNHAAEETGGDYYKVATNAELWPTYHSIAARLKRLFPSQRITDEFEGGVLNENFEVPDASRMIINVERNESTTTTTLIDPEGNVRPPARQEPYYEIYNFQDPMPGRWTIRFEGPPTKYIILIDVRIADLNILALDLPKLHPVNKPLTLRASITDDRGAPLEGAAAQVAVSQDGGSPMYVDLHGLPDQPSIYEGAWIGTTAGDYKLTFLANHGEKQAQEERSITLDELLYLEILSPQEGQYLQVAEAEVAVMRGDERVEALTTGDTPLTLDVTLLDSGGGEISTLPLSGLEATTDTSYIARFEDLKEDSYRFLVKLEAPDEGISDQASVRFSLSPKPPPVPTVPTDTPEPTNTPRPDEPTCLETAFAPLAAYPGDELRLEAPMNTSELENPVVIDAVLDMGAESPIELRTTRLTLKEGQERAVAELTLTVKQNLELEPGTNRFTGNITFNVQNRERFCAMTLDLEIISSRVWLPEADLKGTIGREVQVRVEYNMEGESTDQQVKVTLDGLPSDLFTLAEDATDVKFEADAHKTVDIPIVIDKNAQPGLYQGRLIFGFPGEPQEVNFSLDAAQPAIPPGLVPVLVGLGILIVLLVLFFILDPLCLRCKLQGQLIYPGFASMDISLGGRAQTVELEDTSDPNNNVVLDLRARKKGKSPVFEVKQAPQGVDIDGRVYQEGEKGVELRPGADIVVGATNIKYKAGALSDSDPFGSWDDSETSGGASWGDSEPLADYDSYDDSEPLGGADSDPDNIYDQPGGGPTTSDDDWDDYDESLDYPT